MIKLRHRLALRLGHWVLLVVAPKLARSKMDLSEVRAKAKALERAVRG